MIVVSGVQVPVVQIVDVITMWNRGVAAIGPVLVLVLSVFDAQIDRALVPVVVVLMVAVTIVDVVDVVVVLDGHMTAVGPVDVRVIFVSV
ncbi:MAG: hypothetical protein RLZ86_354 [Actinomycetota bacterium]|jgi:hypothetical protein